jgi:hypothetical protein
VETGRTFKSPDNHAWKRRNKRPIVRLVKPLAKRMLPDPMIARLKTEADQRQNRVLDAAHWRSFRIDYFGQGFRVLKMA